MAISPDKNVLWVGGNPKGLLADPTLDEFIINEANGSVSLQLRGRMKFEPDKFPFQYLVSGGDPDWFYLVNIDLAHLYIASFTQECPPSPSIQKDNVGVIVGSVIGSVAFIALVLGIVF